MILLCLVDYRAVKYQTEMMTHFSGQLLYSKNLKKYFGSGLRVNYYGFCIFEAT